MADERKGVVTFRGNPVTLSGPGIKVGQPAPDFSAVDTSLGTAKLADARGKVLILSSVPSLDTPVCDTETRRFNEEAAKLGDVEVWTISMDLPFAQKRWCGAAGITHVKTLSDFREREFGQKYGVLVKDGPLAGVDARAVFVVAKDGKVARRVRQGDHHRTELRGRAGGGEEGRGRLGVGSAGLGPPGPADSSVTAHAISLLFPVRAAGDYSFFV